MSVYNNSLNACYQGQAIFLTNGWNYFDHENLDHLQVAKVVLKVGPVREHLRELHVPLNDTLFNQPGVSSTFQFVSTFVIEPLNNLYRCFFF